MGRPGLFAAFLATALCSLPNAHALDETLQFHSRTVSESAFLAGDAEAGRPVTLTGRLQGPDASAPQPVVILLHGTDGPGSGAVWAWSRFLHGRGIASLSLDSYSGRGIADASTDQNAFGQFTQIFDAYRAVETLAAHPGVDGGRIAVMGFSRGGNAALYSAMTRFQDAFGPNKGAIAAHLAFYPACNFELSGQLEVADAPIRLFHGAEDDWTLPEPCQDYIDALARAGHDAEMTQYPGVRHAFDNARNPAYSADADWQTSRDCLRREQDGQLINAETGLAFSYDDACVRYGPSVQYDSAATRAAQEAVAQFLGAVFEPD